MLADFSRLLWSNLMLVQPIKGHSPALFKYFGFRRRRILQRWVKNGRDALEMGCLYYPRKQTSVSYAADADVKRLTYRPTNKAIG
jgi:hypothetical protein